MPPLYLTYKLKQLWSNQYETVFQINGKLHSNIFYGNGDWCNRLHRICASRDAPKHLAWTSIKKMGTLYSYLLIKFVLNICIIKNDTQSRQFLHPKRHISVIFPFTVRLTDCMYICIYMYVCMYGSMDGWTDGWMEGRMDGWMHPCMHVFILLFTLF